MKELQIILPICAIYLLFLLFSTLEPWRAETFGEPETIEEKAAKLCAEYKIVNGVIYCRCDNNKYQEPEHCEEKYK